MMTKVNGIALNFEVAGEGPPLLLLHGFTGSVATWAPLLDAWSAHSTIAVDLIGHGRSESPEDYGRYAIDACLDDLAALLDQLDVPSTAVLGYSMGGRIALRFALRFRERVSALVLESASPGILEPAERAERVASDEALARRIEAEGIESFVDYWEALPLWASQAQLPAGQRAELHRARLECSPMGLAGSLRGMGAGRDDPVLDRLGELPKAVLLIAGALDEKYASLATAMAARIRGARAAIVEAAGHAVHLEKPREFEALVLDFLKSTSRVRTEARTL